MITIESDYTNTSTPNQLTGFYFTETAALSELTQITHLLVQSRQ